MSSPYRRYAQKRDEIPSTSTSSSTRRNLSVTGEPSTTGTSWASLRFNKPMTDGYRGHSSRLASTFEPSKPSASSSYAPSLTSLSSRYSTTSSTAKETPASGYVRSALANYQKAVASSEKPRQSRPSVAGPLMTYRSQVARDMFSPTRFVPSTSSSSQHHSTTINEPTSRSALANSYLSRTKSPPSRSIFSPTRVAPEPESAYSNRSLSAGRPYSTISSASSNASSYQPLSRVTSSSLVANRRPHSTYESDQLSLAVTKALNRPTPKADRPWRQRMADAARIRNIHGDDISSSVVSRLTASRATRRNSIGQNSGDELQNSLNALKTFVADPTATDKTSAISKYRAKNGNPMDTPAASDPRPTAGFTNGPTLLPGSLRPYRTSGYGKTLTEAQMSESFAGTPSLKVSPTTISSTMSRSYSPNRSGTNLFEGSSPRNSYRYPSHESVYHPPPAEPLFKDKGQTIIEEIQERWGESSRRRHQPPRSSKERTARHNSRQRSLSKEPAKSSSSEDEESKKRQQSRDPPKKRKFLRKRTTSIPKKKEPEAASLPPQMSTTSADAPTKNVTQESLQSPPSSLPTVSIDLAPSQAASSTPTTQSAAEIRISASGSSIGLVTANTGGPSRGGSNTSLNIKTEEEFKSANTSPQISPMGNKSTKLIAAAAPPPIVKPPPPPAKVASPPPPAPAQPPPTKPPSALQRVLAPFRRKSSSKSLIKPATTPPTSNESKSEAPKVAPVAMEESISESISESATTTTAPTSTYIEEDESKYNAIAEFKPGKSRKNVVPVKPEKPVPGIWQGITNEINISCNRNLTRKVITHLAVEALLRDQPYAKAVPKKFKQPAVIRKKKLSIVEKSLEVVLVGHPQPPREKVFKTLQLKRPLLVYRVEAKFSEPSSKPTKIKPIPVSALAVLNKEILNKKRSILGCEKILKAATSNSAKLSCKEFKEATKNVELNIRRKEEKRAANVTVIAVDVMDVNWAKASKKLKAIIDPLKKNLAEIIEQQSAIVEAEKERLSRTPRIDDDEISSSCSEYNHPHHQQVETQASIVLTGLRNCEESNYSLTNYSSHLPIDHDYIPGEPLILPDKSILEEYVHRKRSELERLYSEPLRSPSRGSPCLSTTSELVPACAVRIVEPRNYRTGIAFISSPNRSAIDSIESSHSLPTSNRNSKMIELISYPPSSFDPSNNNNNNSSSSNGGGFRTALRKPIARREGLTLQHFDTPKTPFEAAMQNQATQMAAKKSSVASNLSALSESDAQDTTSLVEPLSTQFDQQQHRRRPSIESTQSMPPIATASSGNVGQNFAQAAALASQPRHERYAAHIPVRQTSTEPSGRQSTTSIDSANSGVLDTASRQLDQMIDQARFRHHQHRSKFKEAIDYLDQIFEDLKKEVEPPTSISSEHKTEIPPPLSTKGIQAAKAIFQKSSPTVIPPQQPAIITTPQTAAAATNVPIVRLRKPSELALRQQQQQQQQQHQVLHQPQPLRNGGPVQNGGIIPKTSGYSAPLRHPISSAFQPQQPSTSTNISSTTSSNTFNGAGNGGAVGPKPFPKIESGDVEISETIILPSKGNPEKMNFTRQWLAGDIKSWAEKPDLIVPSAGDLTSPNDSDDRSIGSCSAEVAAINALDRKKKRQVRETPDIIKSSKTASNHISNNNNNKPTIITANNAAAAVPGVHQSSKSKPQQLQQQQHQHQQSISQQAMPTPLRPQPLRPQPQYAQFPINGQLSNESTTGLQKAPSHEYVMAIQRAAHHQERAGSQDYQSLGSVHSQDGYKPLSTLSLYSNSLNRSGAFQQYPQRGSIHSLPDASLSRPPLLSSHYPTTPTNYATIHQDPILAMDALVAELELNTDSERNGDKRRSFPIGYGNSSSQNNRRPIASTTVAMGNGGAQMPRHNSLKMPQNTSNNGGSMDRGLRRMQIQQRSSLDEMANMLTNVAGDLKPIKPITTASTTSATPSSNGHYHHLQRHHHPQQPQQQIPMKKFGGGIKTASEVTAAAAAGNTKIGFSPFETINQERFAPSRVGAMQQMFETKKQTNGNENGWRKAPPSKSSSKEEENYYEIQDYSQAKIDRPSPMQSLARRQGNPSPITPTRQPSFTGSHHSFPLPQPPSVPPPPVSSCVSSANSSQHGYYSSSTSSVGKPNGHYFRDLPSSTGPQRRGSFIGKHSLSSRAQSFDDDEEDDGFYDNIIQTDDRRFSEADNASILSHQLPPTQKGSGTGRLGNLIRRIGGGGSSHRSNTSSNGNASTSSMSLNKMGIDGNHHSMRSPQPSGHHPLMKSNSLSNEPWRTQIIEGADKRASHPGIGYRLKQTIFGGSKKRLN